MGKIIPIKSSNIDFWQWGKNCQFLNFGVEETEKCLEQFDKIIHYDSEEVDLFWEGYYSESELVNQYK